MANPYQSFAIADVLVAAQKPIVPKTIVVNTGVHHQAVTKHLELLERNELVARTPKGAWMLTSAGREVFLRRCRGEFGGE